MSNKPNTLESVGLAIELLRRIPKHRKVTASELHTQLQEAGYDRNLRTIQRQLDSLSEHFDIERDARSKPYGYKWKPEAKGLSLPVLSRQESLLLMLAEQQLKHLLPTSLLHSLESFFSQARANLDVPNNPSLEREWLSKVRVVSTTQPLLPPPLVDGVFEAVTDALYRNKWLNVSYRNASGRLLDASVMPLGLAQQGPRLYLVCRFEGYDNERILALNRLLSAEASTLGFKRPADFSLADYDADGRFGFGNGNKVRLTFKITREAGLHLTESLLSHDQEILDNEDHYEISATVVDSAQLEWWLRGFGEDAWDICREAIES